MTTLDAEAPMLTPVFRVSIDGTDVTNRIRQRVGEMTITLCREDHADQLELSFEDTDGRVAIPRKGVMAEAMLGFEGRGMFLQGTFTVDDVGHEGAPDIIRVHARSARVASPLGTRKERSWSDMTIGHVVNVIAGEHGLKPRVSPKLASVAVTHIDQTESDMAMLKRLGKLWDAVATVKNGCLIFAPIGHGQTASGQELPTLAITRAAGDRHHFQEIDRASYTGVRARWHDVDAARGRLALAGKNGHVKIMRGDYASEADAKRAAEAEFARMKRGAATFQLTLAIGRPDVYPETPVTLRGWPEVITAMAWIVAKVIHKLDGSGGYTTQLELENRAAASDHAAVDEGHDGDDIDAGEEA